MDLVKLSQKKPTFRLKVVILHGFENFLSPEYCCRDFITVKSFFSHKKKRPAYPSRPTFYTVQIQEQNEWNEQNISLFWTFPFF
jgi:hypothetical protein